MPAKRLPWFKFWIDATTHGKVRQLDDATFRTWVELLDAAAKQPIRGRFSSIREAEAVTRRPRKHIAVLIAATLIDDQQGALVMHDWDDWQKWRPGEGEDLVNNSPFSHERLRNGRVNTSDTTTDRHEYDHSPRAPAGAPASGEERREKRDVESTPLPPKGGGGGRRRKSVLATEDDLPA